MGSAPARRISQSCSRESLEGSPPAHYEAQGQCPLHLPASGEAAGGAKRKWGTRDFKTPKWSAVRRDRPIARPVRLLARAATETLRHYGAPLPLRERTSKRRTESSGGNPPARKDEYVQAKWAPVRRPDMRPKKDVAV